MRAADEQPTSDSFSKFVIFFLYRASFKWGLSMRYALACLISFNLGGLAQADHDVFLTWEGQVSAPVTLKIRGDRVEIESLSLSAVSGASFRFHEPMPRDASEIRANVRSGNGVVRIIEQPTRRNGFAALVRINPRGHGTELYRLEFTADTRGARELDGRVRRDDDLSLGNDRVQRRQRQDRLGGRAGRNSGPGALSWSGRVDHEAVVIVQGRAARATTVRGRAVTDERANFTGRLPNAPVEVQLADAEGRGEIQIIEQPGSGNGYTAKVRIFDGEGGDSQYRFTLQWQDGSGSDSGSIFGNVLGGVGSTTAGSGRLLGGRQIVWRGFVDGRVRVNFQGDRSWVERLAGGAVSNVRADFGSMLPRNSDVDIRKVRGRDDVEVIERPSASNGYRLILEIEDSKSGADEYEIEVTW